MIKTTTTTTTTTKTEQTSKTNDCTLKRAHLFCFRGLQEVRQIDYTLVKTFCSFFPIFSLHWAVDYNLMPRGVLKHPIPKRILLINWHAAETLLANYELKLTKTEIDLWCLFKKFIIPKCNLLNLLGHSRYKGLAVVFSFSASLLIAEISFDIKWLSIIKYFQYCSWTR